MDTRDAAGKCELCGRIRPLTFHHLIPRTCHSNKWFKKNFKREEMSRGINICYSCHSYLHDAFSEKDLGRYLNTKEALLAEDKIQRFVEWIKRR
ncbi:MAG: hypothetical protein JXB30_20270 [Anaerolineae bacterium]|nr:hypothetical protein [Anaerolineae bacterium]